MRVKLRVAEGAAASPRFADVARESQPPAQGLAAWLLRMFRQRREQASDRRMEVLETLVLGPKKHLTLVECEGRRFLVGGGADNVAAIIPVDQTAIPVDRTQFGQYLPGHDLPGQDRLDQARPVPLRNDALDEAAIALRTQSSERREDVEAAQYRMQQEAETVSPYSSGRLLYPNDSSFYLADAIARIAPSSDGLPQSAKAAGFAEPAKSPAQVAEEILQALREMQFAQQDGGSASSDLTREAAVPERVRRVPFPVPSPAPAAAPAPVPSLSRAAAPFAVPSHALAAEPVLWSPADSARNEPAAGASFGQASGRSLAYREIVRSGLGEVRRGDGADRMREAVREAVARMGEAPPTADASDQPLSSFSRHPLASSGEESSHERQGSKRTASEHPARRRPQTGVGGWA
ncbi:MAG: flagellar biosynthetic protein FliO [Acidobacteriaceae bacterium]